MEEISYIDTYFAVASIATIAVAGLLVMILFYIIAVLRDIKKLSGLARKEAEMIARSVQKGAEIFGSELSNEAAGFLRAVFALFISKVSAPAKRPRRKI